MKAPADFRPEQLHRRDWYVQEGDTWRLRASRCSGCGMLMFPAAHACPRCWPAPPIEDATVPETGTLLSWTTAEIAPASFAPPYAFGYADMTPTVRLFGQIDRTGDPPLAVDMKIELVLGVVSRDHQGQAVWAYKFAPAIREG